MVRVLLGDWEAALGPARFALDHDPTSNTMARYAMTMCLAQFGRLAELEPEIEEAAASLGANRWQTMTRVILPELMPPLITGFALAFARALGEYGSVVFISANLPMRTEIVPQLIITKLEQYDYRGATAIAVVMLIASFALLLLINLLQKWSRRYYRV